MLILFFALIAPHVHAETFVKGPYLPQVEDDTRAVCRITVGKLRQIYTPTSENGQPAGMQPYVRTISEAMMCSASLINSNTLLTAAHCFVGNNEQLAQKGKFPYPKMNPDGSLVEGCQADEWMKNKNCIAKGSVIGVVTSKWENIYVECPTGKQVQGAPQMEKRALTEETGYPHPLFNADQNPDSISRSNFDVTVWRVEKPFESALIMPVQYNEAAQMNAIRKNWRTCKSFGYGKDNFDHTGVLRGVYTPIVKAHDSILYSDNSPVPPMTDDDLEEGQNPGTLSQASIIEAGRTDHGDSGGALVCKDLDGVEKLFGVVSRGGVDQAVGNTSTAEVSLFAKVSYNADWIKLVLETAPLVHTRNSDWWDAFVLPTETQYMQKTFDQVKSCMQEHRFDMSKEAYSMYQTKLSLLQKEYKKALDDNRRYGDQPGFVRIKVRDLIKKASMVYFDCEKEADYF